VLRHGKLPGVASARVGNTYHLRQPRAAAVPSEQTNISATPHTKFGLIHPPNAAGVEVDITPGFSLSTSIDTHSSGASLQRRGVRRLRSRNMRCRPGMRSLVKYLTPVYCLPALVHFDAAVPAHGCYSPRVGSEAERGHAGVLAQLPEHASCVAVANDRRPLVGYTSSGATGSQKGHTTDVHCTHRACPCCG